MLDIRFLCSKFFEFISNYFFGSIRKPDNPTLARPIQADGGGGGSTYMKMIFFLTASVGETSESDSISFCPALFSSLSIMGPVRRREWEHL